MTVFKHFLVGLGNPEYVENTLKTAFLAAQPFSGHLNTIFYAPLFSGVYPLPVSGDNSALIVAEMSEVQRKTVSEDAQRNKKIFDRFARLNKMDLSTKPIRKNKVSGHYKQIDNYDVSDIVNMARVSDIVVFERNHKEKNKEILEMLLTQGGKPLLLPSFSPVETFGRNIAIIWDGSKSAGRSVFFAMPYLQKAEKVTLYETGNPETLSDAQELAKNLLFHDVEVKIKKLKIEGDATTAVADALLETACAQNDLLVMGAYGENSVKRLLCGSVLSCLTQQADVSLFLAH